jgi:transcriptional regulator with XRE-family HTH domain
MGETTPRRTRRPKQPRIPGDFAALVRGLRESRGMTQQEMGELLGFPAKDAQSNYGKWERGDNKPNDISVLRQIEDVLGVMPGTLVDAAQRRSLNNSIWWYAGFMATRLLTGRSWGSGVTSTTP